MRSTVCDNQKWEHQSDGPIDEPIRFVYGPSDLIRRIRSRGSPKGGGVGVPTV